MVIRLDCLLLSMDRNCICRLLLYPPWGAQNSHAFNKCQ